jgi:hypothetical protein
MQDVRDASLPSHQCVELIYKSTGEGSGARRLLIDLYACKGNSKWMRNERTFPFRFHERFSTELVGDEDAVT